MGKLKNKISPEKKKIPSEKLQISSEILAELDKMQFSGQPLISAAQEIVFVRCELNVSQAVGC